MSTARLLIVQTGNAAQSLRATHGDYPDWFARSLGFEMPVVRAHDGEKLAPALDRAKPQGVIVTGSPLSVVKDSSRSGVAANASRHCLSPVMSRGSVAMGGV